MQFSILVGDNYSSTRQHYLLHVMVCACSWRVYSIVDCRESSRGGYSQPRSNPFAIQCVFEKWKLCKGKGDASMCPFAQRVV
jgi:hypothetical protein